MRCRVAVGIDRLTYGVPESRQDDVRAKGIRDPRRAKAGKRGNAAMIYIS